MARLEWFKMHVEEWARGPLAGCSPMAQWLWMRLQILMHDSDTYGHLTLNGKAMPPGYLASRVGLPATELVSLMAELDAAGVPQRTDDGVIFDPHLVRDEDTRNARILAGSQGGRSKALANVKQKSGKRLAKVKQTSSTPPSKHSLSSSVSSSPGEGGVGETKALPFDTREFRSAWADWEKHRREIKSPLTPTTIRQQLREFGEWGQARSIAAITHTIKKGWVGLREPDGATGPATTPDGKIIRRPGESEDAFTQRVADACFPKVRMTSDDADRAMGWGKYAKPEGVTA